MMTESESLFLRIHVTILYVSGFMSEAPFSLANVFQVAKG